MLEENIEPRMGRRKCLLNLGKGCLVTILVFTVVLNVNFILETNRKLDMNLKHLQYKDGGVEEKEDQVLNKPIIKMSQISQRSISLDVVSSKEQALVKVNGEIVLNKDQFEVDRGIHVVVINQASGGVMAQRLFDTYQAHEDEAMLEFLNQVSIGRILVFTIKDEGTFQLKESARNLLTSLGSESATSLHWRDMWAFITIKGHGRVAEILHKSPDLGSWADRVALTTAVQLVSLKDSECVNWADTAETRRRRVFCNKYEGYGSVCDCDKPTPVEFTTQPLESGGTLDIPVSVIASNRPQYLFRMLKTLLQTPGVPKEKITVFVDGYFDEPLAVTQLFGLRGIQHTPLGVKNARISQHYKASISATFNLYPDADYIILIEEDLELSIDFFSYLQQTKPLLERDPTLYCISAWNDQGYDHSCKDPALLYRIETMPGLGWMMKKSLFKDELEPQWPSVDKKWDWDMWMRHDLVRKGRECIIPDVSRTFHFGSKGLNINPYFQEIYFQKHTLQSLPNVKLKDIDQMTSEAYEKLIKNLIQSAKVLDHSINPCASNFIPDTEDETFVMYIQMKTPTDFDTWKRMAKCYHLWDLDVRGFHKSMWRQFHKDKHLIIVGVPASPYAEFKPNDVTPIYLPAEKEDKKRR